MTLTQTAQFYKMLVKVVGIVLLVLIVLRVSWGVYKFLFPSEQQIVIDFPFDAIYGPIPPLELEKFQIQVEDNYSMSLDLVSGALPGTPQVTMVYPVLKAPYGFLSEDRAISLASRFGMNGEPTKIDDTNSVWKKLNEIFRINDQTLNFVYQYNYSADPSVFFTGEFTSTSAITNDMLRTLEYYGVFEFYGNDLNEGNASITMLQYDGVQFTPVRLIAQSEAARVDIPRRNVTFSIGDESRSVQFFSPSYVGSVVHALGAPKQSLESNNLTRIVDLQYTHWKYVPSQGSLYPVITPDEAFVALQQSPATFTVFVGNDDNGPVDLPPNNPEIAAFTIRRVEFGSPVIPATKEAMCIYFADMSSTYLNIGQKAIDDAKEKGVEDTFGGYNKYLGTAMYLGD